MSEDCCLICHESVINKTFEDEQYITIYQTCNCIYTVHKHCLIAWSKRKSKCIICHRNIFVYKNGQDTTQKPKLCLSCCNIL